MSQPSTLELNFITLTQGQVTVVDTEDADLAELRWYAQFNPTYSGGAFVARRTVTNGNGKRRVEYLHRVILARVLGHELATGESVDHANGNPLDNRRENLRLASRAENVRNQTRRADNTSGFKGVTWHKQRQRWQSRISVDGKKHSLGLFDNAEEAARAYDVAARELHGEFARLNFTEKAL